MKFTLQDIKSLAKKFETASPQEIIVWAVDVFSPNIVFSSSFQTQSVPLLHMVKEICPETRIFFLDTGMHFRDTLIFREDLQKKWNLNIVDLHPDKKWDTFLKRFGSDLPKTDPNLCCDIRKVQPMREAVEGLDAWITGIRRDQTEKRAYAQILEYKRSGLLRIAPLLNWTREDIEDYIVKNNLPRHPLPNSLYPSIGCEPCTRSIQPNERVRAGRWAGQGKVECGLHNDMFEKDTFMKDNFKLR